MITVVDVGLGNVASVHNMLDRLGIEARLRQAPEVGQADERFILPGVGAFDEGVERLSASGWYDFLRDLPPETHILGICLGMQLLGRSSEEGIKQGLGRVPAHFVRFPASVKRVPHMGWNIVEPVGDDPIFDLSQAEIRFYFTHSFHAVCDDPGIAIGRTCYGEDFTSAYRFRNTRGVQFHPEKSHRFGMSLLSRWAALPC